MNKTELTELLKKFAQKTINKDELQKLSKLLNALDNESLDPYLTKIWDHPESSSETERNIAFNNLMNSITIPENSKNLSSKKKIFYSILKYAAVVLITAGITAILPFHKPEPVAELTERFTEFSVPNGSKSFLVLPDSTKVWLNSGTTLKYSSQFLTRSREVYLEGEAYFDVKHRGDIPMVVKTSTIQIKVFGTSFNVKSFSDENIVETTLLKGSVSLETLAKDGSITKTVPIKPNEIATFIKETGQVKVVTPGPQNEIHQKKPQKEQLIASGTKKPENIDINTAWKENRLTFRRKSIEDLMKLMERWYGVEIILKNDALRKYSFTGTFENETVEQALNALSYAYPFHYTINKNVITIKP